VEASGYKSITLTDTGTAVILFNDGRELTVAAHVAEGLQRARAEEGLPPIPVTRATTATPMAGDGDVAQPDLLKLSRDRIAERAPPTVFPVSLVPRQWKVTIGGQIEGVTDDPRFPALFEAALASDPEVNLIKFGEPSRPLMASAVLLVSAPESHIVHVLGMDILKRNLHVAAQAIIGDKPYGWALEVEVEPFPSQPH
jgi:hypothetical protein